MPGSTSYSQLCPIFGSGLVLLLLLGLKEVVAHMTVHWCAMQLVMIQCSQLFIPFVYGACALLVDHYNFMLFFYDPSYRGFSNSNCIVTVIGCLRCGNYSFYVVMTYSSYTMSVLVSISSIFFSSLRFFINISR